MTPFIQSLKRLYTSNQIDLTKLEVLKTDGKIDQTEYDFIITQSINK